MKHSTSLQSLQSHARKTKEITKNIAIKASDFSTYLSLFLANSRGKDKLLSLLQYTFDFVHTCGRHSNIPQLLQAFNKKELLDMLIYYNLKQNISSARKVFRLFRFFDEIKGLAKIVKTNRPLLFKVLSVFTYFCSCSYYICDNSLWFLGVLIKGVGMATNMPKQMSEKYRMHRKDLKRSKNTFSLYRIVAYLIILIYSVVLDTKHSWGMVKDLQRLSSTSSIQDIKTIPTKRINSRDPSAYESAIHIDFNELHNQQEHRKISKNLIEIRRRIRFYYLEIAISLLRMIMLTSSLKLPYHDKLDPIFVATCGLFSSTLNFIKTIFEKKIIVKVDKPEGMPAPSKLRKQQSMDYIQLEIKGDEFLSRQNDD